MAQSSDIIDLRRSYIPVSPDAFPVTMHNTGEEDAPEARIPVIPYDGYNFMPTPTGYASFFGINTELGIDALDENIYDIFIIQTDILENKLVALTETGIWTKAGNVNGAWEQEIELDPPEDVNTVLAWSKCVIDNTVYVYRQGEAHAWRANSANDYVFTEFTPSGINMAGQLGVFKAGGRLAFWDSANSIGWSSLTDITAFGNADELSGFTVFQDIVGKIVVCYQHGDGFIVYCTKSIVHVQRNAGSPMLFLGRSLFNNNGISYRREAVYADPDTLHFAFTTNGLVEISSGQAQIVMPEIATYFREKRQPIFLFVLNGRYLHFTIIDPFYLQGRTNFHSEFLEGSTLHWQTAVKVVDGWTDGEVQQPCKVIPAIDAVFEEMYLFNNFGYTRKTQATTASRVPIWEDHLATIIPIATLEAWRDSEPGNIFGSPDYFEDKFTIRASVAAIDGSGNIFLVPEGIPLASAYAQSVHVEDNTHNFYQKQDMLWWAEERFFNDWLYAIDHKDYGSANKVWVEYASTTGVSLLPVRRNQNIEHQFGPLLRLTIPSESNRYYGAANKSAWEQRSIVQGITLAFTEQRRIVSSDQVEAKWTPVAASSYPLAIGMRADLGQYIGTVTAFPVFDTYAEAMSAGAKTEILNWLNLNNLDFGSPGVYTEAATANTENISNDKREISIYFQHSSVGYETSIIVSPIKDAAATGDPIANVIPVTNSAVVTGFVGEPQYIVSRTEQQSFYRQPRTIITNYEPCIYKELGFTKIKGHGHYSLAGSFIVDDATAEAADYVDQCTLSPPKDKRPQLLGQFIGQSVPGVFCGKPPEVTIHDDVWEYTDHELVIPGGEVLFQEGSFEPYYPTFLGAFVFDIQYKKWGKMQNDYKLLLDLYPINTVAGDAPIPFDTFLPKSAMLDTEGLVRVFDQYPSDSQIVVGKYGMSRKGFTDLEEIKLQHRTPMTGRIVVETSFNGRDIEPVLTTVSEYDNVRHYDGRYSLSGRWYNIIVEGNYDIINLEARSHKGGSF